MKSTWAKIIAVAASAGAGLLFWRQRTANATAEADATTANIAGSETTATDGAEVDSSTEVSPSEATAG